MTILYHAVRKCCQAQRYNKDKQINQGDLSTPSPIGPLVIVALLAMIPKLRAYSHKDVYRYRDAPLQKVCC